jgi:phospholipid/cholesterol/gamma-HCH transport system substrate-binding protein
VRDNLGGAIWRLAIFLTVCVFGIFSMFAIFAQLRFQEETTYKALFTNVAGLEVDQFVRIAGVEVGKVKHISIQPDTTALVEFSADDSVVLTEGTRAVIRYNDLIGGRYLGLEEGAGGVKRLNPGYTIPPARTSPALDLDTLIGGFRPLFHALDPGQVNALTSQLIRAFQGEGGTIDSFLSQAGQLTNTLADRDQLIGEVVTNLNTVLGSIGDQNTQFAKAVDSLSDLVSGLAQRKGDISNSVAYANAAAAGVAELLTQARPPLKQVVIPQLDRTAGTVLAEKDYVDDLLKTLPDSYQILNRQGLYGDYFTFYMCDIVLKLNGKGGQPVYIKMAGQDSGRCTPR